MLKKIFFLLCFAITLGAHADWNTVEQDELEKPESAMTLPAFDLNRLVPFEVNKTSSMQFAIDPATVQVTSDLLVRYVVVATSSGGARNISYEGLRCKTGEAKTYARYNDGKWNLVANPVWKPLQEMGSKYALEFATQAACDGVTPLASGSEIVTLLKKGQRWGR